MSENNSIDLPNLNDIGSPEQAQEALNKLHASSEFQRAYYQDQNHPQHGDIHRRVVELNRIINEDQDPRPAVQRLTEDAMQTQADKQEQRLARAEELMGEFEEFGWPREEIHEDLTQGELEVLEAWRFVLHEDWPAVTQLLERGLMQLPKVSPDAYQAFTDFRQATKTRGKQDAALRVLRGIRDAGRARIGLKPRQVRKDDEE